MAKNSKSVKVINLKQKLGLFKDYWNPMIVGELNNHKVQVVKLKGEFVWHYHKQEDELFLVIKGSLIIHFRGRDVKVNEGEFVIIPHLLEHKPEAKKEVHIVLIEPKTSLNTGNVKTERTAAKQTRL